MPEVSTCMPDGFIHAPKAAEDNPGRQARLPWCGGLLAGISKDLQAQRQQCKMRDSGTLGM